MVAGEPACGWPPGSASTTTGLCGPGAGGGGVGGRRLRVRERDPGLHPHRHAALGAVAAPVARVRGARGRVGRVRHDVPRPGGDAVGRRLAEGGPAERREVPGQHVGVEGERERLAPGGERRRHRPCGPAALPARSWQSAVESVRSRLRSATSTLMPSASRVATTSWSAIELPSSSIRTCTPISARWLLPNVLASRLTVSFAAAPLTSHATERRSALPDGPEGASLGSSRVCTAALAVPGASIRSIARVAMYVRIRTTLRRNAVQKQTRVRQAVLASSTSWASDASMPSATTSRSGSAS